MHEHAFRRRADLAAVGVACSDDRRHGDIEVRVLPHDRRCFAAELERHAREVSGCADHDVSARVAMARERDQRRQRIVDERLAHRARAGDEVDHAGRQFQMVVDELHEGHRRQR